MAAKFLQNEWTNEEETCEWQPSWQRESGVGKASDPAPSRVDTGQGLLGETDGIIIHILSVLFISGDVFMFFIILRRETGRPLFLSWTNYPLSHPASWEMQLRSILHVCLYLVYMCVFLCGFVSCSWIQGFPVEIIIDHNTQRMVQ